MNEYDPEADILIKNQPKLFMEAKNWWSECHEEVLNHEKNRHLRI